MAAKGSLIVYQDGAFVLRRGKTNQAEIGQFQRGNHAEGKERENHRWIFDRRADLTRGLAQSLQILGHIFEGPVGHDTSDGQRNFSENFSIPGDHVAALILVNPVDGGGHVFVCCANQEPSRCSIQP